MASPDTFLRFFDGDGGGGGRPPVNPPLHLALPSFPRHVVANHVAGKTW